MTCLKEEQWEIHLVWVFLVKRRIAREYVKNMFYLSPHLQKAATVRSSTAKSLRLKVGLSNN